MLKKMVLSLCLMGCGFAFAQDATPATPAAPAVQTVTFPKTWGKYGNAESTVGEDGTIKIVSQGNGGISSFIKVTPNVRFDYSFEAKGEGKIAAGLYGAYGWTYTATVELKNDQWTTFKMSQADVNNTLQLVIFSRVGTPATFEIKNLKAVPMPMPEMDSDDMEPKLFAASEYRGGNAKIKDGIPGALNGKAVWGKRWYYLCNLPVPANSKELFYYVHAKKSVDKDFVLYLRNAEASFTASNKYKTPAGTAWTWVKIGPVKASFALPTAILLGDGDENVEMLVDKIVVTTNGQLAPADLDKVQ